MQAPEVYNTKYIYTYGVVINYMLGRGGAGGFDKIKHKILWTPCVGAYQTFWCSIGILYMYVLVKTMWFPPTPPPI